MQHVTSAVLGDQMHSKSSEDVAAFLSDSDTKGRSQSTERPPSNPSANTASSAYVIFNLYDTSASHYASHLNLCLLHAGVSTRGRLSLSKPASWTKLFSLLKPLFPLPLELFSILLLR